MPTLPRPCLMVMTDRTLLSPNWTLAQALAPAVTGGATFVLFRETDLPPGPRASVFRFVKDGVRGRVPLVAAGDPVWANAQGADGVHLEGGEPDVAAARAALGADKWVGVTVTSLEQAERARGADYLLICVDWNEAAAGLETIRAFAEATDTPIVAGADAPREHAGACMTAGAAGVAVVHAAMQEYDRTGALRAYAHALGIEGARSA